jgi:hypothetical protein
MNWTHKRDQSKAEQKKKEARSGTKWSFVAAAITVA